MKNEKKRFFHPNPKAMIARPTEAKSRREVFLRPRDVSRRESSREREEDANQCVLLRFWSGFCERSGYMDSGTCTEGNL